MNEGKASRTFHESLVDEQFAAGHAPGCDERVMGVAAFLAFSVLVAGYLGARMHDARSRVAPEIALTDQDGAEFRLSALRGRPVVLVFGYTHGERRCATALDRVATALGAPEAPPDARVALVTVDPQRDSTVALKRFVGSFGPRFTGLTGSEGALDPVYADYHIPRRFARAVSRGDEYAVEHPSTVFYIGRRGTIDALGTHDDAVTEIVARVSRLA